MKRWLLNWCGANCRMILAVVIGGTLGFGASWWLNQPIPPWIEFSDIKATYERGSKVVGVSGVYTAHKECTREEEETAYGGPNPLVWRQEVVGTGPEVVNYAPKPEAPVLELGTHPFRTQIPLKEGIEPDGWQVSILVTCANEPAIRSQQIMVEYLPARKKA